ncbi:MAG: winged helix-turn-helix domain-containing protein [Thermoplasmatota archaeon]
MASRLWHVVVGTRGGPKRAEILSLLERRPYNAHEISRLLGVDYKTARHHLSVLVENGLITAEESRYATLYTWSPSMREQSEEWARIWAIVRPARKPPQALRMAIRDPWTTSTDPNSM